MKFELQSLSSKKLTAIVSAFILPAHSVRASIIDDGESGRNLYGSETMPLDILNWLLGIMFIASIPIFLAGIYLFIKEKKKNKEDIKILSLIWEIILAFIASAIFLYLYFFLLIMVVSRIAVFLGLGGSSMFGLLPLVLFVALYVFGIYFFAKGLLELTNLNLWIISSILLFLISMVIYSIVLGIIVDPLFIN